MAPVAAPTTPPTTAPRLAFPEPRLLWMIAPAMAPATPPMTAPFFVLSREVATSAAKAVVAMRAMSKLAMNCFIWVSFVVLPPLSQRGCHIAFK